MSYGMQKNDNNTGTQLNLSNYNSLHPLIYLICLSKQKKVTRDSKQLNFRYRLSANTTQNVIVNAVVLYDEMVRIKQIEKLWKLSMMYPIENVSRVIGWQEMINKKPIAWFRYFKNQKKLLSKEISWQQQLAEELHKSIKSNFTRRHIIVDHIDETWSADLVDMQSFNKWNKGYKYLLMVIDVFSTYG